MQVGDYYRVVSMSFTVLCYRKVGRTDPARAAMVHAACRVTEGNWNCIHSQISVGKTLLAMRREERNCFAYHCRAWREPTVHHWTTWWNEWGMCWMCWVVRLYSIGSLSLLLMTEQKNGPSNRVCERLDNEKAVLSLGIRLYWNKGVKMTSYKAAKPKQLTMGRVNVWCHYHSELWHFWCNMTKKGEVKCVTWSV